MITKYNTYIKESNSDDNFIRVMINYFNTFIPRNTNIEIICENINEIIIKKSHDDYTYILLFELSKYTYYDDKYWVKCRYNNDYTINVIGIDEYKKYIKKCIDNFYNDVDYSESELQDIPVFNTDKYSDYVYNLICKDNNKINQIKSIEKYLNKETLKKLEHLINANNFDLL